MFTIYSIKNPAHYVELRLEEGVNSTLHIGNNITSFEFRKMFNGDLPFEGTNDKSRMGEILSRFNNEQAMKSVEIDNRYMIINIGKYEIGGVLV